MFYYPPYHTAYSWTADRRTPKRAAASATAPVVSSNANCVSNNKRSCQVNLRTYHLHCQHQHLRHHGHGIVACSNPLSLRRSVSSDNVSDVSSVTPLPAVGVACSLSRQGSHSSSRRPCCVTWSPGANVASGSCSAPRPCNIRRQQYQLARVHSAEEHPQAAAKSSCSTASSVVLASSTSAASATAGLVSNVLVVCGDSSAGQNKLQQTAAAGGAAHLLPSGRGRLGNTPPNSIDPITEPFAEPQQIDICEYVYPQHQPNHQQHPQPQTTPTRPAENRRKNRRKTSSSSDASQEKQPALGCLTHICHFMATFCGLLSLLAYAAPFTSDSWIIVSEPVPEEGSMKLSSLVITTGMTSSAELGTLNAHSQQQQQHSSSSPSPPSMLATQAAASTAPPFVGMKGHQSLTTTAPSSSSSSSSSSAGRDVTQSATTSDAGTAVSTTLVISKTVIHIGVWTMCPYIFTRSLNKTSSSSAIYRPVPCPLSRPGDILSLIPVDSWPPFDYSSSVLNRLRISTPFLLLGFLFLPLAATTLLFFPLCKRGNRNLLLTGAAFLFGGLSLGTGLIIYISILGEEIKLLPHTSRSRVNYRFGWPFISAVGAFTLAELSALLSALVYLRRMSALGHAACFLQQSRDPHEDVYLAAAAIMEAEVPENNEESSFDEQRLLELLSKQNEKAVRRQSMRQHNKGMTQNHVRMAQRGEEAETLLPQTCGHNEDEEAGSSWCNQHRRHVCRRAVSSYVLVHSAGEETGSDVTCNADEQQSASATAVRKSVHFSDSEDVFVHQEKNDLMAAGEYDQQEEGFQADSHQCHHHPRHHHHQDDFSAEQYIRDAPIRHTCGNFGQTVAILTTNEAHDGDKNALFSEMPALSTFTPTRNVCPHASQSPKGSACSSTRRHSRIRMNADEDDVVDDGDLC